MNQIVDYNSMKLEVRTSADGIDDVRIPGTDVWINDWDLCHGYNMCITAEQMVDCLIGDNQSEADKREKFREFFQQFGYK